MIKLEFNVKGDISNVLSNKNGSIHGSFLDYLWGKEIEITNIKENKFDASIQIIVYGYEGFDGAIDKMFDKSEDENIFQFFNDNKLSLLSNEIDKSYYGSWE